MLLEKDLKKILEQLSHEDVVEVPIGNSDFSLRLFDNSSKIALSTPVYFGGNFIPSSVRKCATQKSPFYDQAIRTTLSIDESKFLITLIYLDDVTNFTQGKFNRVIEEFSDIAEQWRNLLDENDRNDLVYVRV